MRWLFSATIGLSSAVVICASVLAQAPAADAPPPGPAPLNAQGRVMLGGATPQDKVSGYLFSVMPMQLLK